MSNKYVFLVKIQGSDGKIVAPRSLALSNGSLLAGSSYSYISGGHFHKYYSSFNHLFKMSSKHKRSELIKSLRSNSISIGEALRIKRDYLSKLTQSTQRMVTVKIISWDQALRILKQIPVELKASSGLERTIHRLRKLKSRGDY